MFTIHTPRRRDVMWLLVTGPAHFKTVHDEYKLTLNLEFEYLGILSPAPSHL